MSKGIRTFEVYYFATGDTTGEKLDNVIDVRITRAGKASSNTAELVLTTTRGRGVTDGEIIYKPDETIKIYAAYGDVDTSGSTDLIGIFTILNSEINPEDRSIKLSLMDRTYRVLSRIWAGDKTDTVDAIIKNIADTIIEDGTSTTYTTNITTTNSSGAAFPSVNYYSAYKTAYEIIQELSQPEYTGDDRTYIFWVDEDNVFNWQYPGQTPNAQEFNYGQSPVLSMKLAKTESEIISMIIYNAGPDKDGNDYVDFYLDPEAGSIKNRMRYFSMIDISKDIKKRTNSWSGLTNSEVQTLLKNEADAKCRRIVNNIGQGLWEAKITIPGAKYEYGGLYPVSATDFGFPSTNLRITRVVHRMNKNGWQTDLTLTEDADAITL